MVSGVRARLTDGRGYFISGDVGDSGDSRVLWGNRVDDISAHALGVLEKLYV